MWIDHKYKAMEIMLQNYGCYLTNSQPLKWAVPNVPNPTYPMYITLYLDILAPLLWLSLAFQEDVHDPVKAIRRIQEFTWIMAKLQMLINESLDKLESILT